MLLAVVEGHSLYKNQADDSSWLHRVAEDRWSLEGLAVCNLCVCVWVCVRYKERPLRTGQKYIHTLKCRIMCCIRREMTAMETVTHYIKRDIKGQMRLWSHVHFALEM